jgi:histidinol-phosphatase (PHP family)
VIVDYHMHLRDASGAIDHVATAIGPYLETAVARGVHDIGFTEHVYYFVQTREIWEQWGRDYERERCVYDLDAYCEAVVSAKDSGLPVKLGVEVDYVGEGQQRLAELLAPYPWDFRLGSVHCIDRLPVDAQPGAWEVMTVEEVWRSYTDALCELALSGTVDVMAHLDLAKIFGRRPQPQLLAELHERIAMTVAAAGVAVEVSTAGLRKPVGELYPDAALLRACVGKGVPVTLASDAHEPGLVGADFEQAIAHARAAGCETIAAFESGQMRVEPLG